MTSRTYAEANRLLATEIEPIAKTLVVDVTRKAAFGLVDAKRDKPVVASSLRRILGAVWDRALDADRIPFDTPNWWRLILRGKLKSKGKKIGGEHAATSAGSCLLRHLGFPRSALAGNPDAAAFPNRDSRHRASLAL